MNQLETRRATEAERAQIYAKVHEFWGRGVPLQQYVERGMASAHGRWAHWYVGIAGGEIVTSLAAHPTVFRLDGVLVPGISIASVHTRPQDRGRGYAPELIQYVEAEESSHSARLSVLYSDIDPAYYARLGYRRAPAWRGWTAPRATDGEQSSGYRIEAFDGPADLPAMAALYAAAHRERAFAVERAEDYWQVLLGKRPHDRYYWLRDEPGVAIGYARIEAAGDTLRITDFALAPEHESDRESFYRLLIAEASRLGAARVGGWLPDIPAARVCFELEPRPVEITMAKPLDGRLQLRDEALAAADFFHEIDHV